KAPRRSGTNERVGTMAGLRLGRKRFDARLGGEFMVLAQLHGWNEPVFANRDPRRSQAAVRLTGGSEQYVRAGIQHGAVAGFEGHDGYAGGHHDDFFSVLVTQGHPPRRAYSDD